MSPKQGSSPLTQGKQVPCPSAAHRTRLIPAHAGKTPPPRHTHSPDPGSSPLTRGKRIPRAYGQNRPGLIPAHAGKTSDSLSAGRMPTAHPRSRGENYNDAPHALAVEGSSPLTRGKLHVRDREPGNRRLIPAHAGKTRHPRRGGLSGSAHPRSRGENLPRLIDRSGHTGSSPLTRGKPPLRPGGPVRDGLIPAHAGKTGRWSHLSAGSPAHPRSRGENSRLVAALLIWRGSSPLTRGKRQNRVTTRSLDGLIPAHAGKTSAFDAARSARAAHPRSRGENG